MRFALALALVLPISARAQSPFPVPTPPLHGTFANHLRDQLAFTANGDQTHATGALSQRNAELRLTTTSTGFTGTGTFGGATDLPVTGTFTGDALQLQLGTATFHLRPEAPLDAALVDLGPPEPDPARNWTIAVYLAGDNDLENAAVADLLEMQQGLPKSGCEVVVLLDRFADEGEPATEWSDTRILRVAHGEAGTFDTLGVPRELDTSDPSTLASFVTGVFRRFPSKHHAVVVWDHGGGYTGIGVDENAPSRSSNKRMLSLADVRLGLATALQNAGLMRLDLVAFDACLMAQLDVALAMRDLADAMVASEAEVPGTGYPYAKLLAVFADDVDGKTAAKTIVESYGSFSEDAFDSGSTLSAFDLSQAEPVALAFERIAQQALAASATQWRAIARALFFAECYQPRNQRIEDHAAASLDLIDFTERLRGTDGIAAADLDALTARVKAMVLARYSGAERTLSHGVSIYGPHRSGQFRETYLATPMGNGSSWPTLLRSVHALADADQSELAVADFRQLDADEKPNTVAQPFGGQRLLFTATGNSIVEVQVRDWQHDAEEDRWLMLRASLVKDPMWPARWARAAGADTIDLVMPQFTEGKNELFHELSGLTFAITDGVNQCYGSLDMTTPTMQAPITAVARCTPLATGQALLVEVAFDHAEWNAVAFKPLLAFEEGTLPRTLEPQVGDTFEFFLVTKDKDGKDGGFFTPALTWGKQGLVLVAEPDEPGRYRAEMVARTLQGRTASASHDYDVEQNPSLASWQTSWNEFDPTQLVGTFTQWKVVGPGQYLDLKTTCEVSATSAPNLFTVLARGGPSGDEFETRQFWNFEWRSLPSLKVVTFVQDGQKFGWSGPVRVERRAGKLVLAMKAVNASGVVWEWRQQ